MKYYCFSHSHSSLILAFYFLPGMSDEVNMSFRPSEHTMTMYELRPRTLKIQDANTRPEVGSSTVNGIHIKETTTIHNTLKTHGNTESTEQTPTSRTSVNTATCSGNVNGRGNALKPTTDATMAEGLLNAVKALPIFLPTASPAQRHHLPFRRGYRVTLNAGCAVGHLKGVEAVVQSPHPDLRNPTRHTLKDTTSLISLRKIVLLT